MSPTAPTGRKKPEMTPSVANRASSAPLRIRTLRPDSASIAAASFGSVRSATHRLRRHGVDSADPHGVGDGAKAPHGLDRATKMVRRDRAGLGQPFGESGERFFVEARHRRPAELVIDQEPDRVRADVDDRVGRPVGALGALGVELERPQRLSRGLNRSPWPSRFLPLTSLSRGDGDALLVSPGSDSDGSAGPDRAQRRLAELERRRDCRAPSSTAPGCLRSRTRVRPWRRRSRR